ncbi:MAG TPA: septal ring lytic transglycosylase RlpA family protein [Longimicrobiales bacterium]
MMTTMERNRLLAGGLLVAASLAIGAASARWSPEPAADAPLLDGFDARPPAQPAAAPVAAPVSEHPAPPRNERAASARSDAAVGNGRRKEASTSVAEIADEAPLLVLEGGASWYADALAGRRTASGEPYDPTELIAAHRALPFGTRLRVTNLSNDRSVVVRVIDRGPFAGDRILDLSRRAAEQIGIIRAGHARVRLEVLEYPAEAGAAR